MFIFYGSQLAGLGGLAVDLAAYVMLRYALAHETDRARTQLSPVAPADRSARLMRLKVPRRDRRPAATSSCTDGGTPTVAVTRWAP